MTVLRNLLVLLIALGALLLGAMLAAENEARVPLNLLVVSLSERSVALWVLLAFALGGVTGMLTSMAVILRLRTSLRLARRQLNKANTAAAAAAASQPEGEPAPEPGDSGVAGSSDGAKP